MFARIDPKLNIENIDEIIAVFERYNRLPSPAPPARASIVAFSGSTRIISKSMDATKRTAAFGKPLSDHRPDDIGRQYEPIQINSQSGGVSYAGKKFGTIPARCWRNFRGLLRAFRAKQTVMEPRKSMLRSRLCELKRCHFLSL